MLILRVKKSKATFYRKRLNRKPIMICGNEAESTVDLTNDAGSGFFHGR